MPVAIFVLNNGGYQSIRLTQHAFFPDNPVGCDPASGVGVPRLRGNRQRRTALPYRAVRAHSDLETTISRTLADPGPQLCEVFLDPEQSFAPKTSSSRLPDGRMVSAPLEDMFPFLDREEFLDNMIIPTAAGDAG